VNSRAGLDPAERKVFATVRKPISLSSGLKLRFYIFFFTNNSPFSKVTTKKAQVIRIKDEIKSLLKKKRETQP
jgi:hypothetical protein